ncbi:MAG TPA: twin-arginine translocase TatA/TatE family subunit [Candidatus Aveggerthella stercoripullorum]|uniref:Sec-independent protein translocase protein TatA n=1 Tax=Candidatus Aveggerthella stercoripullorum TaxID=2840688 RepID=A0A9D1D4Y1_9ACTN|nr:twin-arginine translocase TatA/TatE family subunit [Candidatus Aveggerthella stercoripullorum]
MRIFGMGLPELLVILGIALLIFGPKQLPKLGSALGKTVKGLREGLGSNEQDAEETEQENAVEALEEAPKQKPAPKKTAAQSE